MRTSILLASAFAATALAKPLEKRDEVVVTSVDVVYQVDVVTVTAGESVAAASTPAASAPAGHHKHHHHSKPAPAPAPSSSEASAPAPAPTSVQSISVASVSVPTTSSEVPAPAPTTTVAPVVITTSSAAPETTTAAATGGVASTYQQAVVNHHNYHRANHSAPAIAWDDNLADIAMSIAKTCVYAHNMTASTISYGQNIAAGVGASQIGETISDLFYNGEVSKFTGYGESQPDMSTFESWGHFSQIVWKATGTVGCATWNCNTEGLTNFQAACPDNSCNNYFTVCNYASPGNVEGEYGTNIGDSLGKATIVGSFDVDTSAIESSYASSTGQKAN